MTSADVPAPTVLADWVDYQSEGATISAYLARPKGNGPWPSVLMVHENPGLTPYRQDVTRRLASAGYVVLTPNLYSRVGGKAPTGETDLDRKRKIVLAVPDEQVFADLMNGRSYLADRGEADLGRLGIIGFCMGGSKGLYAACHTRVFRCFVSFYGVVALRPELTPNGQEHSYLPLVPDLGCPMQYHVGEMDDANPPDKVRELEEACRSHGKDVEFHRYPGAQHAFHDDTAPRYHAEAARLAWSRTLDYFKQHLQADA